MGSGAIAAAVTWLAILVVVAVPCAMLAAVICEAAVLVPIERCVLAAVLNEGAKLVVASEWLACLLVGLLADLVAG